MSPRKGLTKEIVIEKGIKLIDEEGWEALTFAKLAKELGIKSPSLYNHIQNLEELKNEIALYGVKELLESVKKATSNVSGDMAIFSFCKAYLVFSRKHPGLYTVSLTSAPKYGEAVLQKGNEIVNHLFKLLESYPITMKEKIHLVRGLRSLLHGSISIIQNSGFQLEVEIDESIEFLIKTWLIGLNTRRDSE